MDLLIVMTAVVLLFVVVVGGVLLLPISRQLGRYLSTLADAGPRIGPAEAEELRGRLDDIRIELASLQERQRFVEGILEKRGERDAIGPGASG